MNEQEQLRTVLIEIFPELTISDFPEIKSNDTSSAWLTDWQSEYESSEQIIVDCEFSNFSWLLEEKFKKLNQVKSSKYDISPILNNIFTYIEQFEDHTEQKLIDFTEVEYDASLFDDDELGFEEQYAIAMDNISSDILQHNLSVIAIEHGENVAFILSQASFEVSSKLEKILETVYEDSDIKLYHHAHKHEYLFENLLATLE